MPLAYARAHGNATVPRVAHGQGMMGRAWGAVVCRKEHVVAPRQRHHTVAPPSTPGPAAVDRTPLARRPGSGGGGQGQPPLPPVEELAFRGFVLAWLRAWRLPAQTAIGLTALLHLAAHPHWFWAANLVLIGLSLGLFVRSGRITLGTRSLVGACVAHSALNLRWFSALLVAGLATR